jgi:hypothetical protein
MKPMSSNRLKMRVNLALPASESAGRVGAVMELSVMA